MAAEASAISWASPAWKTSMPNCFAFRVNSFTSASPTAIRTVSTAKRFSVPGTTFQPESRAAIVADSTRSRPAAQTMVWAVKMGTPSRASLSACTL